MQAILSALVERVEEERRLILLLGLVSTVSGTRSVRRVVLLLLQKRHRHLLVSMLIWGSF